MGQFDLIMGAIAGYLLISGLVINWFGKYVSASRQHQIAFVTILLLILGIIPQFNRPMVAPGIIFSTGMMLFALHLSAYYSGTPKNSARLYSVILILSALVLLPLSHSIFSEISLARLMVMGGVWVLLLELERIVSVRTYAHSRVERNMLWIWFLASAMSLWEPKIVILPDLLFLILLILHLEKRWPRQSVPAPLVALYGMLFVWYAHYALNLMPLAFTGQTIQQDLSVTNLSIIALIGLALLILVFRSPSVTKQLLYLFIAQEIIVLGLQIENLFQPTQELIGMIRLLLFVALIGLFVMIESRETQGLDKHLLEGMRRYRPRFTFTVLAVALAFTLYPLIHYPDRSTTAVIYLVILGLAGVLWVMSIMAAASKAGEPNFRILRPSLSIWSTVVFTILWATVIILEIFSRGYLGN